MTHLSSIVIALALFTGACSTRSISDSGYGGSHYGGELIEMDLVGVTGDAAVTQADIAAALADTTRPVPDPAGPLLLIQSGALAPDSAMVGAMERHFTVFPFLGLSPRGEEAYGMKLRLAAAKGGFRQILIYWGMIETERRGGAGKLVSWVPLVGDLIPDESQHMRIGMRAILIDVASGRWRLYKTEFMDDDSFSMKIDREQADQDQVRALKRRGYEALAAEIAASASP
ncbi:MAG: hypothetical protein PHS60_05675 [Zavarzinia sp.]|nr:hypothetical protein [Zavarzinia sp.]